MVFSRFHLSLILPFGPCLSAARSLGSSIAGMERAADIQRQQLDYFLGPVLAGTQDTASEFLSRRDATTTVTFSNPKAKEYYVDGMKIPEG